MIPSALRRQHEDNLTILFCGAGVSKPAKLPDFDGLVRAVLDETPTVPELKGARDAYSGNRFDEALNIVERYYWEDDRETMRRKVNSVLGIPPGTRLTKKRLENHINILRLVDLPSTSGRLVTTNFDQLFEFAGRRLNAKAMKETNIEVAPALSPPKPASWNGLIYLHGRLNGITSNRNLILTTADFGRAYLVDAWASRFAVDLFRHFNVVFLGYSLNDPVLRYLVSAIQAARQNDEGFKEPYAFADFDPSALPGTAESWQETYRAWVDKGVTPILYSKEKHHEALWSGLQRWAASHIGGLNGKIQILAAARGPRTSSIVGDEEIDMIWALSDIDVVRTIGSKRTHDLHPSWVSLLSDERLLETPSSDVVRIPIVGKDLTDAFPLDSRCLEFIQWLVRHLSESDPKRRDILNWVISEGAVLHRDFRSQIRQTLKFQTDGHKIHRGLRKIWSVLADDNYAQLLSRYHRHDLDFDFDFVVDKNNKPSLAAFMSALEPLPIFSKPFSLLETESEVDVNLVKSFSRVEMRLVRTDTPHELVRWKQNSPDWDEVLSELAFDISGTLKRCMDWRYHLELASDGRDASWTMLKSIAPHDQDKHAKHDAMLLVLCRDAFLALRDRNPQAADRLVRQWALLPYPLFRRLVLFALAQA